MLDNIIIWRQYPILVNMVMNLKSQYLCKKQVSISEMQYLTCEKEYFASSSKTYQVFNFESTVLMGLTFDICIELDKPLSKAYKSIGITFTNPVQVVTHLVTTGFIYWPDMS